MTYQRVNLRAAYSTVFGDADTQRKHAEECERARAEQQRRGIRYAVAPGQSITTKDGRKLEPGDEVKAEDFARIAYEDDVNCVTVDRPPWKVLEDYVRRGAVLEAYGLSEPPSAA
ncbi:MAG TPA: hypothetical protein VH062_06625 [Polyangiaceae bacterium]|jgi:hypothetical protein|nr:hypothetical protein [Polyangiaceae bacterium]